MILSHTTSVTAKDVTLQGVTSRWDFSYLPMSRSSASELGSGPESDFREVREEICWQ